MKQFGVSFNSIEIVENPELVDQILQNVRDGVFDFVQFHARVTTEFYDDIYAGIKKKMNGIRAIVHAPFYLPPRYLGVDTSDKNALESNFQMLEFSQKSADLLKAEVIVLHPGIGDSEECVNETIRQIKKINDERITIENLPYDPFGVLMHGGRVENIKRIVNETNCKFCFDFGHAVCAANSLQRDIYSDFKEYFALNPDIYHLSDGDFSTNFDDHLHLGLGNYDITKFLREFTNENSMVVLETFNPASNIIDPWLEDAKYLRNLNLK